MKPSDPGAGAPGPFPGRPLYNPAGPPAGAAPHESSPLFRCPTPPPLRRDPSPRPRPPRASWGQGAQGCSPDWPAAPTPGQPRPDSLRGAAGQLLPLSPPAAPPARRRGLGSTSGSGGRGASGDPGAGSARDRGQAPRAGWGLRASGRGAASRRAGVTPAALPQWVPPPGAGAPTAAVTPGDHPAGGGSTRACDLEKLREGQGLGGGRGPHRK